MRRLVVPLGFLMMAPGAKYHPVPLMAGSGIDRMAISTADIGVGRPRQDQCIDHLRIGIGLMRGRAVTVQTGRILAVHCRREQGDGNDYHADFHPTPLPGQIEDYSLQMTLNIPE